VEGGSVVVGNSAVFRCRGGRYGRRRGVAVGRGVGRGVVLDTTSSSFFTTASLKTAKTTVPVFITGLKLKQVDQYPARKI